MDKIEFLDEGQLYNSGTDNDIIAVIIIRNSKLLVMDHVKTGKLCVPVGSVEVGDSIMKTFTKEMSEELDIDVSGSIKVLCQTYNDRTGHATYGYCKKYTGILKNMEPEKHTKLYWYSIEELLDFKTSELCVVTIEVINIIEENGGINAFNDTKYEELR